MWRSMIMLGIFLSALFVLPAHVTLACQSGCNGGVGATNDPNMFAPKALINHGNGVVTDHISYKLQFNIGQDISLVEISAMGSNDWTPLVDDSQTPIHTKTNRIAHIQQDIFDHMNIFDIRINGTVVWHNIEVQDGRLIVLGYDNAPLIVGMFDGKTNLRTESFIDYCPAGYVNLFSPKVQFKHNQSVYNESIDYNLQFNIGQDLSLIEIAPVGSNNWTPIVNASQMTLATRSSRIARIHQDIFDNMYAFDIRINGVVTWHNIEVKNDRLIILGYDITLGYNNAPVIVDIVDGFRRACMPIS